MLNSLKIITGAPRRSHMVKLFLLFSVGQLLSISAHAQEKPSLFRMPDMDNNAAPNSRAKAVAQQATMQTDGTNLISSSDMGPDISIFDFDKNNNLYFIDPRKPANYGLLFRQNAGSNNIDTINLLTFIKQKLSPLPTPNEPFIHNLGTLTIDDQNRIYIIYYLFLPGNLGKDKWKGRLPVLLFSGDNGKTFNVYQLPGNPDLAFMETRMNNLPFPNPPVIGMTKSISPVFNVANNNKFAFNQLSIVQPVVNGSALSFQASINITSQSPGTSNHTGGNSSFATTGNYTYLAYNMVSDDKKDNHIYLAAIDKSTNKLLTNTSLGTVEPPFPDPHATPVAVFDKTGTLHVVSGSQGYNYVYYRCRVNGGKVTIADTANLPGHRVYASLICDNTTNNITLAYTDYDPQPSLYLQTYNAATRKWQPPTKMVSPPSMHKQRSKDNFGIYYFRLGIDRKNVPYLSYSFLDTYQKQLYPRVMIKYTSNKWSLTK